MSHAIDLADQHVSSSTDLEGVRNLPCSVPWCDRHATGHPTDGIVVDRDGSYGRTHSADAGYLSNAPGPHSEAWVDVSAFETLSETSSSIETPHVTLYASNIELTADEARRIAGWLQQAAQRLDAIAGA